MPGMASGTSASGGMDDSDSSDDDAEEDGRRSTLGSFGTFGEPLARTKAGDGFVNRGEEDEDEDRVRAYVRHSLSRT
jgi:SIT4-associating protein SAP185/190